MKRFSGLFLLALGATFALVGVIVAVALIANDSSAGFGIAVAVFLPVVLVGAGLIYGGVRVMRGQKPFEGVKQPRTVTSRIAGYLADAVEPRELRGQPFEVFYQQPVQTKNKRPSFLTVRVAADVPAGLHFSEENWFDRLCKRVGIAREYQTGDTGFDGAVYVRSPAGRYVEWYLEDHRKRTAILALKRLGFREIRLTGTHVEAVWRGFDPQADGRPHLPEDAAEELLVLAASLPETAGQTLVARNLRPAFETGLWVVLVAYAVLFAFVFVYPPVRVTSLLLAAVAAFVPAYLLFGWVAAFLLRGESTSHDRWGRLMSLGLLLFAPGTAGAVALVNGWGDSFPPDKRVVTVVSKWERRGKRNRRSYHVSVRAWDRPDGTLDFELPMSMHAGLVEGRSKLELTTGRGFLGIEWLRDKRVRE